MARTEVLRLVAGLVWVLAIAFAAAERRIVRTLVRAAADSPGTATPIPMRSPFTRLRLARLRRAGAVVATGPARFYLDPAGFARYRHNRRRRAVIVFAALVPLIGMLWWTQR